MEFFKNISDIKSDNCRDAANEFLTIAATTIRNLETYYGNQQFAGYQLFGRETHKAMYKNDGNTETPGTEYTIELVYPMLGYESDILPGTVYETLSADAVGFYFKVATRDFDDSRIKYGGSDMHVYFFGCENKRDMRIYHGTPRTPSADEYARITQMMDALRQRRARELCFQHIIDRAK